MIAAEESVEIREHDPEPEDLQHGVHMPCQKGAEFVVSACGLALSWSERNDETELLRCAPCYEATHCPVCGTALKPEGA